MMVKNNSEAIHEKTFPEFLRERMGDKRVSIDRLEKETNIQRRYIEALLEGDIKSLPAAPYVRGYVRDIASVVGYDPDKLWKLYQKDTRIQRSGSSDILPGNRYIMSKKGSRWLIGLFVIVVLLLLYLLINGRRILGSPSFVLNNIDEDVYVVEMPSIVLSGSIDPDDTLTLNGEIISIDDFGNFQTVYFLEPGVNTLIFRVKRFLGREKETQQQIIYDVPDEPVSEVPNETNAQPTIPSAL